MMAESLPPSLKIPEVSRFINRANQLRSIKPAIAYWCKLKRRKFFKKKEKKKKRINLAREEKNKINTNISTQKLFLSAFKGTDTSTFSLSRRRIPRRQPDRDKEPSHLG